MTRQTQEAYIVAATRTPVGKAPRGMFRNTRPDETISPLHSRLSPYFHALLGRKYLVLITLTTILKTNLV